MTDLVKYDQACRAIADAVTVDEAKDIRDKGEAMRAYARQAKNRGLEIQAAEIRLRAERRIGQMMQAQKDAGLLNTGRPEKRGPSNPVSKPTLEDAGIDKNLAKRARKLAASSNEEFEAVIDEWREQDGPVTLNPITDSREILDAAKEVRAKTNVRRREERLDNLAEIAKGNDELDTSVRYPVIYADPPWRYENPPIGGSNRSIENHYPTMTLDEICAMPVKELATDDAMLYMWATAPKLIECLEVVKAWGFEYRTNMIWDKEKIGMGYHARNQHEILLICKRGEIPPPEAGTQPSSVYREARGKHSEKPMFFYEMIEGAYPGLPKIELFCRTPRDGWAVWGNQSHA